MATERAALEAESQQVHAKAFQLSLDLRRRHQIRLPPQFEERNLFTTLDAGPSNPPDVTRAAEAPVTGAVAQPCATDPLHVDLTPLQRVSTPLSHYSNPLDNMIATASRLAALPIEGESPVAIEARNDVELL